MDMGRREGSAVPFRRGGGAGSPSNTAWPDDQVASLSIQPFGHNRQRRKLGAVHLLGGTGSLSNITSLGRGLPLYQVPS